ncbi:MAG TPA: AAA family ATPase, partial [Polyangium sp.]|nr:AAA family ATPase [Polyangium sp.]
VEAEQRREHIEEGEQERGDAAARKKQTRSTPLRPNDPPKSPLTRLEVRNVGPASEFVLDLAPRLNLLTGDNSLGKTFVLDVLWWTLTGSWVGHPAKPEPKRTKNGKIAKSKAAIIAQSGSNTLTGSYNALHERWSTQNEGPLAPGLVIYARVDGGFSLWDPIRNANPIAKDELDLSSGFHFSPQELWEGKLAEDKSTVLCKGLREDLVDWSRDQAQHETMELLGHVLQRISPPGEEIKIGKPERFKVRDARDVPRLELPYGLVFAEHASAAVKRMLSLAYALVWSVTEVRRAAAMAELDPLQNITFLIDEIEAHLHPKWQRTILRALLELANEIAPQAKAQLVVTTHAPLVLVSIQNIVDEKQDALFDFDLEIVEDGPNQTKKVSVIEREPWEIHGDVNAWLGSEIFNDTHVLSKEQDEAIENASRLLDEPAPNQERGRKAFDALVKTLGPKHPQLLRFRYLAEKKGWLS